MIANLNKLLAELNNLPFDSKLQLANLILVVLTIIAGYFQLRLLRQQLVREHRKSRSERALSYFASHLPEIRKIRNRLEVALPSPGDPTQATAIPIEEIRKAFGKHEALEEDIIAILGHWESMALTISAGFTDEHLAFEMVAGSVVKWVHRFHDYIQDRRKAMNPRLYVYLLPLADKWQKRLTQELTKSTPYFLRVGHD